jgi:hypothetical protein
MDSGRLGQFGEQPAGEVLRADGSGQEAIGGGAESWERLSAAIALVLGRNLEATA